MPRDEQPARRRCARSRAAAASLNPTALFLHCVKMHQRCAQGRQEARGNGGRSPAARPAASTDGARGGAARNARAAPAHPRAPRRARRRRKRHWTRAAPLAHTRRDCTHQRRARTVCRVRNDVAFLAAAKIAYLDARRARGTRRRAAAARQWPGKVGEKNVGLGRARAPMYAILSAPIMRRASASVCAGAGLARTRARARARGADAAGPTSSKTRRNSTHIFGPFHFGGRATRQTGPFGSRSARSAARAPRARVARAERRRR